MMPDEALSVDVAVIGAGPAGAHAAIIARQHGLSVAVIDENASAGGQVWRAPLFSDPLGPGKTDRLAGEEMRAALDASGAKLLFQHKAWFVAPGGHLGAVGSMGALSIAARATILATGTSERVIPIPGGTLPGVIGLAAATIALKAHGTIPPGPTVVAGVGPLIFAVAAGLLKAGGQVAAVVDLARPSDWLAALPALASRPDLLRQGIVWAAKVRAAGVPLHFGSTLSTISGADHVEEVEIRRVGPDWAIHTGKSALRVAASSVAIGHGLTPAGEAARLLCVPQRFAPELGGWVPEVAADRSTTVPGVYIAGDCAGISGAAAAVLAGRLAGASAARDLGAISGEAWQAKTAQLRTDLTRAERFGQAISRMMSLRPGLVASIPRETVVCRCEDVTRATIEDAARRGALHVNQVKSTTRCGMGPCQGRMCGDTAAELVAQAAGIPRAMAGIWTARTPLRIVPLAGLLGDYSYDDIPKPPPLPG
jgi:thioredoxin reductase/bacterioferritin-associated ferredoxin